MFPSIAPAPSTRSAATARPTPRVSVVVPAHDEEQMIGLCLSALLAQTVAPREILVVDNRSSDSTAQIVLAAARRQPWARIRLVEQHEQIGITPTRNRG